MIFNQNQNQIFLELGALGSGGGSVPATPTGIDLSSDSLSGPVTVIWFNSDLPVTNEIFKSTDGVSYAFYDSVAGNVQQYVDPSGTNPGDTWFYKVRACNGFGCSPLTVARGIANQYITNSVPAAAQDLLVYEINGAIDATAGGQGDQSFALLRQCDGFSGASSDITSLSAPVLEQALGSIDFSSCANLTTVDIHSIFGVNGSLIFPFCPVLTGMSVPLLVAVNELNFEQDFAFVTADFSSVGGAMGTINFEQTPLISLTIDGANSFTEVLLKDSGLQFISFANLSSVGVNFDCSGCGALTSIIISGLTAVGGEFNFNNCSALTALSVPVLANIGSVITLSNSGFVLVDFPALGAAETVLIDNCPDLESISFASLAQVASADFSAASNPSLEEILLPLLSTIDFGSLSVGGNGVLTTLDLGSLNFVAVDILIAGNGALVTLDLTPLTGLGQNLSANNCFSLVNVLVPNLTFSDGFSINFLDCALDVGDSGTGVGVDGILQRGVDSSLTASNIELSGGTNAAPSATGAINAGILSGAGCTVSTN